MGSLIDHTSQKRIRVEVTLEWSIMKIKSYEKLEELKLYNVTILDENFTCPYCPKKTKQGYLSRDLLRHASEIGNCKKNGKRKGKSSSSGKILGNRLTWCRQSIKTCERR